MQKKLLRATVVILIIFLFSGLIIIFFKALVLDNRRPIVSSDSAKAAFESNKMNVAAGSVVDSLGKEIAQATVKLSAYNTEGQLIWDATTMTNDHGVFVFQTGDIPSLQTTITGAMISAEAPLFLSSKKKM